LVLWSRSAGAESSQAPSTRSFGRVIDVPRATGGSVLRILMNADLDEAVGILAPPGRSGEGPVRAGGSEPSSGEDFWRWRLHMAERIASQLDPERFGVKGFYVFGSVKNCTAGPASDLDVIVHFDGDARQRQELVVWLEAWGRCLAEMNFLRTGCETDNLLDVHLVTDDDIERRTSYASKIGAVTDAARPLELRGSGE